MHIHLALYVGTSAQAALLSKFQADWVALEQPTFASAPFSQDAPQPEAPVAEAPVPQADPQPAAEPAPVATSVALDLDAVRAAFRAYTDREGVAAGKALLTKYEARAVKDLRAEQYEAFVQECGA